MPGGVRFEQDTRFHHGVFPERGLRAAAIPIGSHMNGARPSVTPLAACALSVNVDRSRSGTPYP